MAINRAVYIGGFGNGKANAEGVAYALTDQKYSDVDVFTFSDAIKNPNDVRKAAKSVDVFTHSAGMLALRESGAMPVEIAAFGAPLPSSRRYLVLRTLEKTVHMHMPGRGIETASDISAVMRYNASATAELVAHPIANLGQLGEIAKFDAVEDALDARASGIDATLVYNDNDDYFQPTPDQLNAARMGGVEAFTLPGEHDELVLYPTQTLAQFIKRKQNQ